MASGVTGQDRTRSNSSREPWPVNNGTAFINQVTTQPPRYTTPVITDPLIKSTDPVELARKVPGQMAPENTTRTRKRKPTEKRAAVMSTKSAGRLPSHATSAKTLHETSKATIKKRKPCKKQLLQPDVPEPPARSSKKRALPASEQQSSEDENRKRAKHSDGDSVFAPLIEHVSPSDLLYTDEHIQHLCFTSLVSAVLLPFINTALANNTLIQNAFPHNLLPNFLPSRAPPRQAGRHTTQPRPPTATTSAAAGQNSNGLLMLLATAASQLPGQNSTAKTSSMEPAATTTASGKETAATAKQTTTGQQTSRKAPAHAKPTGKAQDSTQPRAKPVVGGTAAKRPAGLGNDIASGVQRKEIVHGTTSNNKMGMVAELCVKRSKRLALKVLQSTPPMQTDVTCTCTSSSSSEEKPMSERLPVPVMSIETTSTSSLQLGDDTEQQESQHGRHKRSSLRECVQSLLRLLPSKLANKKAKPLKDKQTDNARLHAGKTASLQHQALLLPQKTSSHEDVNPESVCVPKDQQQDSVRGHSPDTDPQNTATSSLHVLELQQHDVHEVPRQHMPSSPASQSDNYNAKSNNEHGNMQPCTETAEGHRNGEGALAVKQLQTATTSTSSNHITNV